MHSFLQLMRLNDIGTEGLERKAGGMKWSNISAHAHRGEVVQADIQEQSDYVGTEGWRLRNEREDGRGDWGKEGMGAGAEDDEHFSKLESSREGNNSILCDACQVVNKSCPWM